MSKASLRYKHTSGLILDFLINSTNALHSPPSKPQLCQNGKFNEGNAWNPTHKIKKKTKETKNTKKTQKNTKIK